MSWTSLLSDLVIPAATLGGVVLTLIYTGRRESTRLDKQLLAQTEQLSLTLADAQRARLHEQRVRLFSDFLDLCVNLHRETGAMWNAASDVVRIERMVEVRGLRRSSRQLGMQVVLLAPSLRDAVNNTRAILLEPNLGKADSPRPEWRVEANSAISSLTRAMSRELGINLADAELEATGD